MGSPVVGSLWGLSEEMRGLGLRTVGSIEPDRGDGRGGGEGHRTAETGQAEDETQRAREPHWYDPRQTKNFSALLISGDRKRTNRYESGNAIAGRLCVGIWSLGSRRRG